MCNWSQWRRQTQEVGGQRLGSLGDGLGDGIPQRGPGQSPNGVLGAKPPETDTYTQIYVRKLYIVCEFSHFFHYNLLNSTSRGLEVFRVFDEWFITDSLATLVLLS